MISDAQTRFSRDQPIIAGVTLSTNTVDNLSARGNVGRAAGRIVVAASSAFTGGTSLAANYIQSANIDLSSPDILCGGPQIPVAALAAGARLLDNLLPSNTKQYVGVQYVPVGTFTGGTVNADIVADSQYNPMLPANVGY